MSAKCWDRRRARQRRRMSARHIARLFDVPWWLIGWRD